MFKNNKIIQFNILLIVFAFFFSSIFTPVMVFADENSTTNVAQEDSENTSTNVESTNNTSSSSSDSGGNNSPEINSHNANDNWTLDYTTEFDNYYVFDNLNRSQLYKKNELIEREDPLALNILISLLAIETLEINTPITISNETAMKSAQENLSNIILNAGSKYEVQFLVYATLFYDSKAALEALTLSLSKSVESFQTLVNSRLRNLNMDNSKLIIEDNVSNIKLLTNYQDMC